MASPVVVIAQNDPSIAQKLTLELHVHFSRIRVAGSVAELHTVLSRRAAQVAVLDLELIDLDQVQELARTFPALSVICTHRSPDERMWMDSLRAGAVEFCHPEDIRSILRASRGAQSFIRAA